jgi:hypothetical protein
MTMTVGRQFSKSFQTCYSPKVLELLVDIANFFTPKLEVVFHLSQ